MTDEKLCKAYLMSISLFFIQCCTATEKNAYATPPATAPKPNIMLTLDPLSPCESVYAAKRESSSAASELETQLARLLNERYATPSVAFTTRVLQMPPPNSLKTSNARLRLFINNTAFMPDTLLTSPSPLTLSVNSAALMRSLVQQAPPPFVSSEEDAIQQARSAVTTNARLLNACRVYEKAADNSLRGKWLVNFSNGASGNAVVIDDQHTQVLEIRPLQYTRH